MELHGCSRRAPGCATSSPSGASSLSPSSVSHRPWGTLASIARRPASRPSQPFGLTVCLSVLRGRLLVRSCALPADSGRRRPPLRGAFAPRAAPRRWSLGCWCPWAAGHASARQAGRAAAARPLRWLSFIQRAAREEVQAPPGVTPPSPQVPTDGGRARWAPMATNGTCPGHRRVPGGRERLCRAVCMYSLYTVLYALSVTRRARAEHLYGARSDYL